MNSLAKISSAPLDGYRAFLNNSQDLQKNGGRFYLDRTSSTGLRAGAAKTVFGEFMGAAIGAVYSDPEERSKNTLLKADLKRAIQTQYPKATKVAAQTIDAIPDLRASDALRVIDQAEGIHEAACIIEQIIPSLKKMESLETSRHPLMSQEAAEIHEALESIVFSMQAGRNPGKCLQELRALQQRAEGLAHSNISLSSSPRKQVMQQRPVSTSPTPPVTPYASSPNIQSLQKQHIPSVPVLNRVSSAPLLTTALLPSSTDTLPQNTTSTSSLNPAQKRMKVLLSVERAPSGAETITQILELANLMPQLSHGLLHEPIQTRLSLICERVTIMQKEYHTTGRLNHHQQELLALWNETRALARSVQEGMNSLSS